MRGEQEKGTSLVSTSPNDHTEIIVCRTPLVAPETICDTGLVTLMDKNPARQRRNPNTPVTLPPQMKRESCSGERHMAAISRPSPTMMERGSMMRAERKLEYQARSMARWMRC